MNRIELCLKVNKMIHDECKDVPHDIGLRVMELIEKHRHLSCFCECEHPNRENGYTYCHSCNNHISDERFEELTKEEENEQWRNIFNIYTYNATHRVGNYLVPRN